MGLRVLQPGLNSTLQDLGRTGFREWGVPQGGAFDVPAHGLANALVGNLPDAATLEMTGLGGLYRAEVDLALGLAGAPMTTRLERRGAWHDLPVPGAFTLLAGERIQVGGATRGLRTYLAVRGGWQTAPTLGSRSSEDRLRENDLLPAVPGRIASRRPTFALPGDADNGPIRILDGPDAGLMLPGQWEELVFIVSTRGDRKGLFLDGPPIELRSGPERLSAPVTAGTIQVAGKTPLVLGAACGTMGGYPHVAQVISADLPRLAQLRPGSSIRFRPVGLEEARTLDSSRRAELGRLLRAVRLPVAYPDEGGAHG